jgi:hypothetical protein
MKEYMKRMAVILIVALPLAACPAGAYDNGDFQMWYTNGEEVKIHKGVKFAAEQEFRFGENASELFLPAL